MRVLLDTNVLLDLYGKREGFYEEAVKLKCAAVFGDIDIWATANSYTDVFYLLSKAASSATVQDAFIEGSEVFNICSVDSVDIITAAQQKWQDFEDCLVDVCAKKLKAHYILTRDKKGFKQAGTPCLTPAEFLALYEQETGLSYAELALS